MALRPALLVALALLPLASRAQELPQLDAALAQVQAGQLDQAAPQLHALARGASDPAVKARAEFALGQALEKKGLLASAMIVHAQVVQAGPSHPHYLDAVAALMDLQRRLDELNLVPNLIAQAYTPETQGRFQQLPAPALERVHFLVGTILQRRGKFEEARKELEAVPRSSALYAKARYLLGVVLSDARYPGRDAGKDTLDQAAVAAFREVADLQAPEQGKGAQEDLARVRPLALLGLGRVHYGRGEYARASEAYERVPRYSAFWDQALFENGFARFQGEDYGGALGSLQALHAPQYAGAFQPESWILKATVYYYSCLFDEAKTALGAFDALYAPMVQQLEPYVEEGESGQVAFNLVSAPENRKLPRSVYLWIRGNERIRGVMRMLDQIDRERRALSAVTAWRGSPLVGDAVGALEDNRETLLKIGGALAKARMQEAVDNIRGFADQAEIIRVQTALDEKDLYEAGVDQPKYLKQQALYRPAMPAEDWNYWKFQGEFWIDEIGYYRYTLKRGCPAKMRGE